MGLSLAQKLDASVSCSFPAAALNVGCLSQGHGIHRDLLSCRSDLFCSRYFHKKRWEIAAAQMHFLSFLFFPSQEPPRAPTSPRCLPPLPWRRWLCTATSANWGRAAAAWKPLCPHNTSPTEEKPCRRHANIHNFTNTVEHWPQRGVRPQEVQIHQTLHMLSVERDLLCRM